MHHLDIERASGHQVTVAVPASTTFAAAAAQSPPMGLPELVVCLGFHHESSVLSGRDRRRLNQGLAHEPELGMVPQTEADMFHLYKLPIYVSFDR